MVSFVARTFRVGQVFYLASFEFKGKVYNQSVPIVLSCSLQAKLGIAEARDIVLSFRGADLAILENISCFEHRKEERCARQFGINDRKHPYQAFIPDECGDWLVGGRLRVAERVKWNDGLDHYRLTPRELQQRFKELQVSNPTS